MFAAGPSVSPEDDNDAVPVLVNRVQSVIGVARALRGHCGEDDLTGLIGATLEGGGRQKRIRRRRPRDSIAGSISATSGSTSPSRKASNAEWIASTPTRPATLARHRGSMRMAVVAGCGRRARSPDCEFDDVET